MLWPKSSSYRKLVTNMSSPSDVMESLFTHRWEFKHCSKKPSGAHAACAAHSFLDAPQALCTVCWAALGKSVSHRGMCLDPCSSIFLFLVCGSHWGLLTAESSITAQFGEDVTLSCSFPSQPGMNLQHLTLTWQKELAGEPQALVVHSYYYGKDQLEKQEAAYRNRTHLNAEGLAQGNASLTLTGVRTQDEGVYFCHVTTELGSTSEARLLAVLAPYTEPHLTFDLSFRLGHTLLTISWGSGYPWASVEWRDGMGTNLTALSNTTESVDAWGLYTLHSKLAVPLEQSANLTVRLVSASGQETSVQHITVTAGPGQRRSQVCLLVTWLGTMTLVVIAAVWILRRPICGTFRRCSGTHFTRTMNLDDPLPYSQLGPGNCSALATPLPTSLGAELTALPHLHPTNLQPEAK
ncbi:CD276 antigen-like [Carettochelys insculpta]|uniref:CD276 antigen-like n=1 Tax=Carettochelys insculpta TaxID=44489 RepID=UPI003EBCD1AC